MKKLRKILYLKLARMGKGGKTPVPSIISYGTKIKGNILDGDVIHIDGRMDGNVSCNELIIGLKGQVCGLVKAKVLNVYGILQGSAEAENIFIAGSAQVLGDVYHKSLAIEPGAYIEGRCVRSGTAEAEKSIKKEGNMGKESGVNSDSCLFKAVSGGK